MMRDEMYEVYEGGLVRQAAPWTVWECAGRSWRAVAGAATQAEAERLCRARRADLVLPRGQPPPPHGQKPPRRQEPLRTQEPLRREQLASHEPPHELPRCDLPTAQQIS